MLATAMPAPITPRPPLAPQPTYTLRARLYLAEPDAHLAYHLRTLPGFTELLPDDAHLPEWLEEEAIEHQWLFGMNLYPYESIFIDHDLMLNTAAADQMAALYQESNFNPQTALLTIQNPKSKIQNPPDHLGLELALMRHLIAAQRQAEATGDHALALHARHLQSRCLHEHLAVWAPTFALTLQRTARRPLHRL